MSDLLAQALKTAGGALTAQSTRLRVIAENIANAAVTASVPGGDPYRRKVVTFEAPQEGYSEAPQVASIDMDQRPFRLEYEPGHPAADVNGYVKHANVDMTIELADMREANRSYLANLQVARQARDAISATIDLLRNP